MTCPSVLQRVNRDLSAARITHFPTISETPEYNQVMVASDTALTRQGGAVVYLEDLNLNVIETVDLTALSQALAKAVFPDQPTEQQLFQKRFALVNDDLFSFLTETSTEVVARICLDDVKKTVKKGALWYEEALPVETLLMSLVLADPRAHDQQARLFQLLTPHDVVQLGGHATVGRGVTRLAFHK